MESVDCVVIGAGVVGLACARTLAQQGREVLVLEATDRFGSGTSSRNSEVIHAGLYYPAGSLKARLCVRGRDLLYDYCAQHHIAHRRCGKLVVATSEAQRAQLDVIARSARANGVNDLALLDRAAAQALEPALACVAALHSPSTGIIDTHALMLALLGEAEQHGAMLVVETPVVSGEVTDAGIVVETGGAAPMKVLARSVVNAAGLAAPAVARHLQGLAPQHVPQPRYAKGSYFSLRGKSPFSRLVYPVPEAGGLGVHLTVDLQRRARFGPDVEWVAPERWGAAEGLPEAAAYRVDPARAAVFDDAIRRYWPALPDDALDPDYAGIRPKISAASDPAADFHIDDVATHGVPGLVNLFGIESPGLTACLAIAEVVAQALLPGR
jgi:L-2-hydroxyglutarate oxidase LhgO